MSTKEYTWDMGCCRGEEGMRGRDEFCSDIDEGADTTDFDPETSCTAQPECKWYSTCPGPPVPQVVDCNRPCMPDEKQRMPTSGCGTIAPYMCVSGEAIGGCSNQPKFWLTRPETVCGDCCKYV